MRTAKLIKAQGNVGADVAAQQSRNWQRSTTRQARDTASNWVKAYQQKNPINPREQFARLFDLTA